MSKGLNIGLAFVVLAVAALMLWLGWNLLGGGIAENVINPNNYSDENVEDIKHEIGLMGLMFWSTGALTAVVWLTSSTLANISELKDVESLRFLWIACLVIGVIIVLLLGYLQVFRSLQDVRENIRLVMPLILLPLFLLSFWPIGCWLFTRASALGAVPGGTWVR